MKNVLIGMYHSAGAFKDKQTGKEIEYDNIMLCLANVDEEMESGEKQVGCIPLSTPLKVKTEEFEKFSNLSLDKIDPDRIRSLGYVVEARYALNMFGKPVLDSIRFEEVDPAADPEISTANVEA